MPSVSRHLRAFSEALFSTDEGPPPAQRLDWLMAEMEDFLDVAGPAARFVFTLALTVVAWVAPLFIFSAPTLTRMPVADRVRALHRMEASFASAPILAVKAFLCVVYYEHPDVQRECRHVGRATFPMRLGPGGEA